jgi:hypothetical protein
MQQSIANQAKLVKRVVQCPACKEILATRGGLNFRHCGMEHNILDCLLYTKVNEPVSLPEPKIIPIRKSEPAPVDADEPDFETDAEEKEFDIE